MIRNIIFTLPLLLAFSFTSNNNKFEDFGEILIHGDKGRGYIRLDWYTPDALPNWGDGRLTILGTKGYIELRKYVDLVGREGTDHLFLVNNKKYEYKDASKEPLTYFERLMGDVINRTSTAMDQSHCLKAVSYTHLRAHET